MKSLRGIVAFMMNAKNKRLKIGFLHSLYAQNSERASWRVTNKYMIQALQEHCGDVTSLAPIYLPELRLEGRLKEAGQKIFHKNMTLYNTIFVGKRYGHILTKRLVNNEFDLILASSGWTETSFVNTHTPIILLEDASFASIHNYYPEYSNLFKRSYHEARVVSERAIAKARLIIYPSQWAAQSAITHYNLDGEKVRVIPWGANIDTPPPIEVVLQRRLSDHCKLLFVGMDWNRKGGTVAFETLLELEKLGIQAELTICGCIPPNNLSHERMRVIPYLNRKDPVQRKQLEDLYKTSDFFFMPTRNECYGSVFCEACSFGLPVIATDTGGVSGAITSGENGFLLPSSALSAEYAELIARVYRDKQGYSDLVKSTRTSFEHRLNWDAWGRATTVSVYEMLEQIHHV